MGLPLPLSRFVGRERDLAALLVLLRQNRLVTLTGPGGCGKTRLALEAAHALVRAGEPRAWFIELAALPDPMLLPATIASTVGLQEYPGRSPLSMLLETFAQQEGLLILDNCEHLLEACASFAQTLLAGCPHIVILATSREALSLAGEQLMHVPSLAFPDPDHLPSLEALLGYDAVRLFLQRAHAVVSSLTVTNENAHALARLCHQLDGIPLAIELAASRVQVLSLEDLAARLEQSFRFLTGGSRTALPRQRTLQATMAWSYHLLSEQECLLFGRLSVFAGSFSLAAAEDVCAGEGMACGEILEVLSHLISKSLVQALEQGNQVRYRLLETVRQYAHEKLEEAGEASTLHRRHVTFFLAVARQAEPRLRSADRGTWLLRLEQEHDNLRAAMRWAQEQGAYDMALHLMGALAWFWYFRGYLSEARQWYEGALALSSGKLATEGKAAALFGAGAIAWVQGDSTLARTRLEESAMLARARGNQERLGYSLTLLGLVTGLHGAYAQALALQQESVELLRAAGDQWGLALALYWLGETWRLQREDSRAASFYQQSWEHFRATGDPWGVALALQGLGVVAYRQQHEQEPTTYLEECLALRRQEGDQWLIAQTLATLGSVIHRQGEGLRATTLFEESLTLSRTLGDLQGISTALQQLAVLALEHGAYSQAITYWRERLLMSHQRAHPRHFAECLRGLAQVAAAQHDSLRAARLLGAAEQLGTGAASLSAQASWKTHRPLFSKACAPLDETAIQAAWEAGSSLSVERTLDEALADSPPHPEGVSSTTRSTPHEVPPQPLPIPAGLSKREVEVLRLIVEGKSNRMIAQALGITEKTVINHVTTIFNKTGCDNRAAATAFALRQGLA